MADKEDAIGALWVKTSARGDYMTGTLELNGEKVRVVVFKEGNKRNEKAPDWKIFKARPKPDTESVPF